MELMYSQWLYPKKLQTGVLVALTVYQQRQVPPSGIELDSHFQGSRGR